MVEKNQYATPAEFRGSLIKLNNYIAEKLTELNESNRYSRRRIMRILYELLAVITLFTAVLSFVVFTLLITPTVMLVAGAASIVFFSCSYILSKLSESAERIKLSDEDKISLQTQTQTFFTSPKNQQVNPVLGVEVPSPVLSTPAI